MDEPVPPFNFFNLNLTAVFLPFPLGSRHVQIRTISQLVCEQVQQGQVEQRVMMQNQA